MSLQAWPRRPAGQTQQQDQRDRIGRQPKDKPQYCRSPLRDGDSAINDGRGNQGERQPKPNGKVVHPVLTLFLKATRSSLCALGSCPCECDGRHEVTPLEPDSQRRRQQCFITRMPFPALLIEQKGSTTSSGRP